MDHRVRVASIVFWALFLVNGLFVAYIILQYLFNSTLFGEIHAIFIAMVNTVVTVIAAVGMLMHENYRL